MSIVKKFKELKIEEVVDVLGPVLTSINDLEFQFHVYTKHPIVPEGLDVTICDRRHWSTTSFKNFKELVERFDCEIESFMISSLQGCHNVFWWRNAASVRCASIEWYDYHSLSIRETDVSYICNTSGCMAKPVNDVIKQMPRSLVTLKKMIKMKAIAYTENKKLHDKLLFILNTQED